MRRTTIWIATAALALAGTLTACNDDGAEVRNLDPSAEDGSGSGSGTGSGTGSETGSEPASGTAETTAP